MAAGTRVAIKTFFKTTSILALGLTGGLSGAAWAQSSKQGEPLSAINWLSRSVVTPAIVKPDPPVRGAGGIEDISVLSLDAPSADTLGLLPAARTGLPRTLWGATPEPQLAQALHDVPDDNLPALHELLMTILLAELDPPQISNASQRGKLFLARIDRLLDLGALEQANALLQQADPTDPRVFRRRFDVALLLGNETGACRVMQRTPAIAPSYPAQIFCLARTGHWDTAELTYGTGRALGQIPDDQAELIERFLDPALADGAEELTPPDPVTPLAFKMMEAIGQPLATSMLPLAFAHADLTENNGWKGQLEAAERLARAGVLDPNRLLGLYTERRAAASGALWDRVSAVSALERAVTDKDTSAVARTLPRAWNVMSRQDLEPTLAALYGSRLARMDLEGNAGVIAKKLGLLSPDYEEVAQRGGLGPNAALLAGFAKGDTAGIAAQDDLTRALKRVFDAPPTAVPERYSGELPDQLGAALLHAIDDVAQGARGDHPRLVDGMKMLRLAGLESTARRAAIELVVLERRG
ncbi:hypothetical protein DL1_20845 [Thioclava dalianensis]|uniref:Antifreeze protein n=1 Tax=Thioclava dalianensis TaxID=1185766 RepID=A0A074TE21_9RHOB|nr:hypothetical protein DL1_20845 [Thioclava dalianensis]